MHSDLHHLETCNFPHLAFGLVKTRLRQWTVFEGFAERDKGIDYYEELVTPKFSEVDRIMIFVNSTHYVDGLDLRVDPDIQ